MARASAGGDDNGEGWGRYFQQAINALLVVIVLSLAGIYMLASATAGKVDNHESRITSLESTPTRLSVIETKLIAQDDKFAAQAEQARRMEDKIDRIMEMQQRTNGGRHD